MLNLANVFTRISIVLSLIGFSNFALSAQGDLYPLSSKRLSIQEAVYLAVRYNPDLRSAHLQRIVDKFSLEIARNEFAPHYAFDSSSIVSQGNKPFYDIKPNISLNTPIGTQLSVTAENQINAGERQTVGSLSITQPLLRGFGPAVNLTKYRNAIDNEKLNQLNLKNTLMTVVTEVIQAYYKLVQDYNNLHITQYALNDSLNIFKMTEVEIKAGRMAPTEIVQQQSQVASQELDLLKQKNAISQDYQLLILLLGLRPDANLAIDKTIRVDYVKIPSVDESIQLALANNIEYQQSLLQLGALRREVIVAKNEQKWKLDLTAKLYKRLNSSDNFANVDINQINGIGGDKFSTDKTVELDLSIPIHDLPRKQKLVKARIDLQQHQLKLDQLRQKLIADVTHAIMDINTQAKQLILSENKVNYSAESLSIAQMKLRYGRTTMFEVTSMQKALMQDQLNVVSQKISYLNSVAQIEKLLGITLDRWGINIRY